MYLWFLPQISLHCPKKIPGRSLKSVSWFKRPGTASALIPIAGTVHLCRTSAAVTKIRTGTPVGRTRRWSQSKRRGVP